MLYFIQDSVTLEIKLGYTGKDDVMERLKDHQTSNPHRLVVLGTCPGEYQDEQRLLRQFDFARVDRDNPVNREWFRPVPELLRFIISRAGLAFLSRAYTQVADALLASEVVAIEPTAEAFLDELAAERIAVFLDGDGRICVSPLSLLTDQARQYIKRRYTELLPEIRRRGTKPPRDFEHTDKVRHPQHGVGMVTFVRQEPDPRKVFVRFPDIGFVSVFKADLEPEAS